MLYLSLITLLFFLKRKGYNSTRLFSWVVLTFHLMYMTMHQKFVTHLVKIWAWLNTSPRKRIEVVGFLTRLLRQKIFHLTLNRVASFLFWTIRLFVFRSAVWNNANLNNVWYIEIGRSLTLNVLLSYWSRVKSLMLPEVLMTHEICI